MPRVKISFIIPARNASSTLKRCIDAIKAQSGNFAYEIIVIDNGSTDSTARIARSGGAKCIYLKKPSRSAARNYGAKKAQGDFFAFVDSDCTIPKKWTLKLLSQFKKSPFVAAGRGDFVLPNDEAIVGNVSHVLYGGVMPLLGGAFLIKRSSFEAAGGFDEEFRFCEDLDFSWKLLSQSLQIAFVSKLNTIHWSTDGYSKLLGKGIVKGIYEGRLRSKWSSLLSTRLGDDVLLYRFFIKKIFQGGLHPSYIGRFLGVPIGKVYSKIKPWADPTEYFYKNKKNGLTHHAEWYRLSKGVSLYRIDGQLYGYVPRRRKVFRIGESAATLLERMETRINDLTSFVQDISNSNSISRTEMLKDFEVWILQARREGLIEKV